MVGYKTFIIPEAIIVKVEDFLHSVTPIQVCTIKPGVRTKNAMFEGIKAENEQASDAFRWVGAAINVVGVFIASRPLALVGMQRFAGLGAVALGLSISHATMTRAREQIHAPPPPEDSAIATIGKLSKSFDQAATAERNHPDSATGEGQPGTAAVNARQPPPPPPPPPVATSAGASVAGCDRERWEDELLEPCHE